MNMTELRTMIQDIFTKTTQDTYPPPWSLKDGIFAAILIAMVIISWIPRFSGPIDLRWDSGIYYVLGTSMAEGQGYRLLHEPGKIQATQYPPLFPIVVAVHQWILGTNDPVTVGSVLRFTAFFFYLTIYCPDFLPDTMLYALTVRFWYSVSLSAEFLWHLHVRFEFSGNIIWPNNCGIYLVRSARETPMARVYRGSFRSRGLFFANHWHCITRSLGLRWSSQ